MTHEVAWSKLTLGLHVTFLRHRRGLLLTRLWQYVVVYLLSNLGTFILLPRETAEATVRDELMWS